MQKYKTFTFGILILLILFIFFHLILWQFTKKVYPEDYIVGDLARMSYKFDLITTRKNMNTLGKKHIPFNSYNNEDIDLITIGDSFSNGVGGGKNMYYQDYIVNNHNLEVLNIVKINKSKNYLNTILELINSGFIDKVKSKYIILETVQRNTYENLISEELDFLYNTKENIFDKIKNLKNIYHP